MVAPSGGALGGRTPFSRINDHASPRYRRRPRMPLAVAVVKNAVSSSIVSKVLRPEINRSDEGLMVFNVDVYNILLPIGSRGFEVFL